MPKRPADEGRLIQIVYYAYVAASALARILPERFTYGTARLLGRVAARRSKKRQQVARNLSRIIGAPPDSPEVQRSVVAAYQSYARYWLETFRLVREGPEFFLDRFRAEGKENLDRVLDSGKGAVVAVCHLGNWDAAGAWVGATGRRLVTVAEVLKPRRMFDFFVSHRSRLGMTIYPAEPGVTKRLVQAVEDGAVVAILADRDLKGRGPVVELFGAPVHLPAGTASIALQTKVPVLVAGVYGVVHEDGKRGWRAVIGEPIALPAEGPDAVAELTRNIAREIEMAIARRPEEWHVFQPFWNEDRE